MGTPMSIPTTGMKMGLLMKHIPMAGNTVLNTMMMVLGLNMVLIGILPTTMEMV